MAGRKGDGPNYRSEEQRILRRGRALGMGLVYLRAVYRAGVRAGYAGEAPTWPGDDRASDAQNAVAAEEYVRGRGVGERARRASQGLPWATIQAAHWEQVPVAPRRRGRPSVRP